MIYDLRAGSSEEPVDYVHVSFLISHFPFPPPALCCFSFVSQLPNEKSKRNWDPQQPKPNPPACCCFGSRAQRPGDGWRCVGQSREREAFCSLFLWSTSFGLSPLTQTHISDNIVPTECKAELLGQGRNCISEKSGQWRLSVVKPRHSQTAGISALLSSCTLLNGL